MKTNALKKIINEDIYGILDAEPELTRWQVVYKNLNSLPVTHKTIFRTLNGLNRLTKRLDRLDACVSYAICKMKKDGANLELVLVEEFKK